MTASECKNLFGEIPCRQRCSSRSEAASYDCSELRYLDGGRWLRPPRARASLQRTRCDHHTCPPVAPLCFVPCIQGFQARAASCWEWFERQFLLPNALKVHCRVHVRQHVVPALLKLKPRILLVLPASQAACPAGFAPWQGAGAPRACLCAGASLRARASLTP